jgi:hypothetical protein
MLERLSSPDDTFNGGKNGPLYWDDARGRRRACPGDPAIEFRELAGYP